MPERLPRWTIAVLLVFLAGALLLVRACVTAEPNWTPDRISSLEGDPDSRTISAVVHHALCERGPRLRVTEDPDAVRVRAESAGSCDDVGLTSTLEAELDAVLGERELVVDD